MDFLEGQGAAKIVLGPLDQSGVAQMAADVLGAEPDSELLRMAERPAGSPFLLVELLSGLREEGLVRIESGRAELVEWRLPHRVSQSMRLRLERMSDSARQVATVASALGRRFSLDDVAAMLNLSPSELLTPVDELIHADMLAECDGRLLFGHDLILEAVRASIPVSVRRVLVRQAAGVLAGSCGRGVAQAGGRPNPVTGSNRNAVQAARRSAPEPMRLPTWASASTLLRGGILARPLVAQTAVWLHAAGGERGLPTPLHRYWPNKPRSAQHRRMFAIPPTCALRRSAKPLPPGLPADLRPATWHCCSTTW
jgi:hypothetical protein